MIRTTKDGRTIRTGKDYTQLRVIVHGRAGGMCECGCGQAAPWPNGYPPMPWEGQLHHVNGRTAGKRTDTPEGSVWLRGSCHDKIHRPSIMTRKVEL